MKMERGYRVQIITDFQSIYGTWCGIITIRAATLFFFSWTHSLMNIHYIRSNFRFSDTLEISENIVYIYWQKRTKLKKLQ